MRKIQNLQANSQLLGSGLQAPAKPKHTRVLYSFAAGAAITGGYLGLVRPWILHWGATSAEIKEQLPGDDLVNSAHYIATHAITIKAPVAQVWPWLVQIGQGRGGFYSYDWLENLVGCDIHNAEQILPAFQELEVGSMIRLAPPPASAKTPDVALQVVENKPERAIVLLTPGSFELNTGAGLPFGSWAFILKQTDANCSRLLVRFRATYKPSLLSFLIYHVLLEPIHFIMERKMLLGIKTRVERAGVNPVSTSHLAFEHKLKSAG